MESTSRIQGRLPPIRSQSTSGELYYQPEGGYEHRENMSSRGNQRRRRLGNIASGQNSHLPELHEQQQNEGDNLQQTVDREVSVVPEDPDIGHMRSMEVSNMARRMDSIDEDSIRTFIKENFRQRGQPESPPQAYGKIDFDTPTELNPLYICLDKDQTDGMEKLKQLMLQKWHMPPPNLVVSVVGGAKRFQFDKNRISTLFKKGLVDIATTTGAWVITPGTNTGVYKMIGDSVKEHLEATGYMDMNRISLIGIAPYSIIHKRELLENSEGNGRFPASYPIAEMRPERTQFPDPNHSHFIFIDDGTRRRFGGEIEWRARFEKNLSSMSIAGSEDNKICLPVIMLLVNGGIGSLEAVYESLREKIPVVTITGSGRAAEVVADIKRKAASFQRRSVDRNALLNDSYRHAMQHDANADTMTWLNGIAEHITLVTICDFMKLDPSGEPVSLDKVLLSALFSDGGVQLPERKSQLSLALKWNRVDFAQEVIFDVNNPDYKDLVRDSGFLNTIMNEALVANLPEFVSLLADNGFNFARFCDRDNINVQSLYKKASDQQGNAFSRAAKDLIESQIIKLKGQTCIPRKVHSEEDGTMTTLTYMNAVGAVIEKLVGMPFQNPYKTGNQSEWSRGKEATQELFYWALLFNRMELAKFFWKRSPDQIAGAAMGAAILRRIANRCSQLVHEDTMLAYITNADEFENIAIGVLNECWEKDRQYTSDLLVRTSHYWSEAPLLSLAFNANMENFLAHPACHIKLSTIWRGDIALQLSKPRILLFALFPFLPWLLQFYQHGSDHSIRQQVTDGVSQGDDQQDKLGAIDHRRVKVTLSTCCTCCQQGSQDSDYHYISWLKGCVMGLQSPMVKCIQYTMFYASFLTVFSLFLTTELSPLPSSNTSTDANTSSSSRTPCSTCFSVDGGFGWFELITYVCAFGLLLQEFYQMLFRDKRPKYEQFREWIKDTWNKLDILAFTTFFIATICRFAVGSDQFDTTRWIYSVSISAFFVRFTQIFYVVDAIGPKMIMIRKMLRDLMFFLVILLTVILGYGVVSIATERPNAPLDWQLPWDIIYRPYWQIYAELFLDDYKNDYAGKWTQVLLMTYLIFTNILLLNLLIAMFSFTFDHVQEKADILWKYNYYSVVKENYDRPVYPLLLPLMIIVQLIKTGCCSAQCCQGCRCCSACSSKNGAAKSPSSDKFNVILEPKRYRNITKFIKLCAEVYYSRIALAERLNIESKVGNAANRIERVIEQLDDLKDDVASVSSLSSGVETVSQQNRDRRFTTSAHDSDCKQEINELSQQVRSIETSLNTRMQNIEASLNALLVRLNQ